MTIVVARIEVFDKCLYFYINFLIQYYVVEMSMEKELMKELAYGVVSRGDIPGDLENYHVSLYK